MTNNRIRDELMHSNGTTAYETFSIIVPSFFIFFILTLLIRNIKSSVTRLLLEFSFLVVPLILIMTVCAEKATTILLVLIALSISLSFILLKTKGRELHKPVGGISTNKFQLRFITSARSTINILSVIAILAVDFRIFPRTYTKTLTYGYSLMDTGVGLYIFANGIVAPELRGHSNTLLKTLKSILPLVVIGGARAILVKEIDYHVPVVEYGIHWNFFITLAAVKIIAFLVLQVVSIKNSLYSGVSLLIAHEIILQLGVAKYVLGSTERSNFISANREGIASSLGYGGLYFLSVSFGHLVKTGNTPPKLSFKFLFKLVCLTVFLLWASLILEKNFGISRRLTNSAYCIWVLFIATFMVALFYMGEIIYDLIYNREDFCKVPVIYEAINYNGLLFFLVANLLTGCVNIMFDTLLFGTFWSLVIVTSYMFINCGTVCLLYAKGIKLKL